MDLVHILFGVLLLYSYNEGQETAVCVGFRTTYQRRDAKDFPSGGRHVNLDYTSLPTAGVDSDSATKGAGNDLVTKAYANDRLGAVGEKVFQIVDEGDDPRFIFKGRVLWKREC